MPGPGPIAVNPPRPRFPPLNALRALEAAARHESFAKAADELGVTPAAVSHQIKALEQWLDAPLFVRHAQGLRLAESARAALPTLSGAFDALGHAVRELRSASASTQLNIAALPSIAQLWLAPQLPALRRAFPRLRISVHALEAPPNLNREPFDLAIFFLREAQRGARAFKVCDDILFPVCAPALAAALSAPADLAACPQLWDTAWKDDWAIWFAAAGVGDVPANHGPGFSLYSLALQAALEGEGVLIAHEALAAAAIAAGTLVAPFPVRATTGMRLEILVPERRPAEALRVVDWLLAHGRQPAPAQTGSV
ncbi:MAG: LysR substrate-binding domain-containing protein [Geminicoccaceae bacterium]